MVQVDNLKAQNKLEIDYLMQTQTFKASDFMLHHNRDRTNLLEREHLRCNPVNGPIITVEEISGFHLGRNLTLEQIILY